MDHTLALADRHAANGAHTVLWAAHRPPPPIRDHWQLWRGRVPDHPRLRDEIIEASHGAQVLKKLW